MLLVTQRLTNLIEADHILVLNQGQIEEQGSHHELVAKQGWYSMVYQRQSQLGKDDIQTTTDVTETAHTFNSKVVETGASYV